MVCEGENGVLWRVYDEPTEASISETLSTRSSLKGSTMKRAKFGHGHRSRTIEWFKPTLRPPPPIGD